MTVLLSNLELLYRQNPNLNIMMQTQIGKSLRIFANYCKKRGGRLGNLGEQAFQILSSWRRKVLNVFFDAPQQGPAPPGSVKPKSLLN